MEINLVGDYSRLLGGIKELQEEYRFKINKQADVHLTCEQSFNQHEITITYENGMGHITYEKPHQFFRAFGIFLEKVQKGKKKFNIKENPQFNTIGPMFDLSRNAVMKQERFYEMIRKIGRAHV